MDTVTAYDEKSEEIAGHLEQVVPHYGLPQRVGLLVLHHMWPNFENEENVGDEYEEDWDGGPHQRIVRHSGICKLKCVVSVGKIFYLPPHCRSLL